MAASFTDAFLIPSATSSTAPTPPSPAAAAGPVLDAIHAAGNDGASLATLANQTKYAEDFVGKVLEYLAAKDMVEMKGEADGKIAKLTPFGAKARYLITR